MIFDQVFPCSWFVLNHSLVLHCSLKITTGATGIVEQVIELCDDGWICGVLSKFFVMLWFEVPICTGSPSGFHIYVPLSVH